MKRLLPLFVASWLLLGCPIGPPAPADQDSRDDRTPPPVEYVDVAAVEVTDGLDRPWSFTFLPDGTVLITERPGRVQHWDGSQLTEVAGAPGVHADGQGGLLDIVLHPEFEANRRIYLSYSADYATTAHGNGHGTRVARATFEHGAISDLEVIFQSNHVSTGDGHFGSRMVFDEDGFLYVTLGERQNRDLAQDTTLHPGSVIRLTEDGDVPPDNPYAATGDGVADEVFTYGHRNPQGLAVQPETGKLWLNEHGPQGGDEVNILEAGANYGWPEITYGVEYGSGDPIGETHDPDMEQPVVYYVPTSIAPSGMAFYEGGVFPEWVGDAFIGALAGAHVRRLVVWNETVIEQEVLFENEVGRVRDVRIGPDGHLYFVTDAANGSLYRVDRAP
ncbi:MAG: PQQ-dependent sugar dehydrogenase [Spirochaetota bacterium]